jgi:hypothetical protein
MFLYPTFFTITILNISKFYNMAHQSDRDVSNEITDIVPTSLTEMQETNLTVSQQGTITTNIINTTKPDEILVAGEIKVPMHSNIPNSLPLEATANSSAVQSQELSVLQITTIMACLMAAVFVAALDVTIIVTALPTISNEFSESAYTWVGTAYVLSYNTSTPLWGKLSDIFGRKFVLLSGVGVFFIGSLMCGIAPSLTVLLAGRAVQGLGGAGCIVLVNICIGDLFSLRDRGLYYGLIGVMWAFASGIGPVLGGVFTQEVS